MVVDAQVRDPEVVAVVAAEELRHARAVGEAERDDGPVGGDGVVRRDRRDDRVDEAHVVDAVRDVDVP